MILPRVHIVFFLQLKKMRKRSDPLKEKCGLLSIKKSKMAVKFSKQPSFHAVMPLRDIVETKRPQTNITTNVIFHMAHFSFFFYVVLNKRR